MTCDINFLFWFQIAEPLLNFVPEVPPPLNDAGDDADCVVLTTHQSHSRQTSAFRFNMTFKYFIEFFHYNGSNLASALLFINNAPLADFMAEDSIDITTGAVLFGLDEKKATDSLTPALTLIFTNNVHSRMQYNVVFDVEWHSLPYGHEGGRAYSHQGIIVFSIDDLTILMSFLTSDPLTPGSNLQVQEQIFANVTITFPEVWQNHYYF